MEENKKNQVTRKPLAQNCKNFCPVCSKQHYLCIAELQACNGPITQYITQFPVILSTHTLVFLNTAQAIKISNIIFDIDDRLGGQISENSGVFNIKSEHY